MAADRRVARGGRRQRGFSLLEVLVAFSIMAFSLAALYQLQGSSVMSLARLERRAHALLSAQSLMAIHRYAPPAGIAERGETPDGYAWQIESVRLPGQPNGINGAPRTQVFHELQVRVSWAEGAGRQTLVLQTVVPEYVPPEEKP